MRQSRTATGVPVTRIETISYGHVDPSRVRYLSGLPQETIDRYRLVRGDILFSHINSDKHLGKTAIFCLDNTTLLHGMNLLLIRSTSDLMMPEFLKFLCDRYRSSGVFVTIAQHAVNQSSINQTKLRALCIPLPPLAEQHRIVAKIDELFTRLDAGVEALTKIKAQVKRYRQAVLKHAFEGKLTAEWREAHERELEPASVLLERMKQERRKTASGRYKELPPLDTTNLPGLSDSWVWARVVEIGEVISGQTPRDIGGYSPRGETPYFRVGDMNKPGNERHMLHSEVRFCSADIERLRLRVQPAGTVIFPKRGGAIATNKKRILAGPAAFDLNIMGVHPMIMPHMFFFHWICSIDLARISDGSNVPQINHTDIDPLPFPLPPLSEQYRIVEEIERRLSVTDQVEQTVDQGLKQAERLRQSILKRAFEGKLVPQYPDDEPADKLLERIRAERAKQLTEKRVTVSRVRRKRSTEGN